ncbi:hypothetical protein AV530_001171 [Patagioenas fasciata monilis]|uniref:Uncharacterized protein n=1 Tax=Patagioenas fasciata monilis TaxID=372326 RepID=A0A1V4KTN6_PATFA|nr:hypothetical protein AV530_001171 [Patagioenas fasciata monilis]
MAVVRGTPRVPSQRLGSFCASSLPNGPPFSRCRDERGGADPQFIKHLKWIITRLMEQVMKGTLKCRDEKKDKGTRRRVVIRPCQL